MKALQLKIPPPIVTVIFAACMWAVTNIVPGYSFAIPYCKTLSCIISVIGGIISVFALYSFYSAKTTINSVQLNYSSSFVVSGVYSFTRNPMYLGLLFVLLGWFLFLSNILAMVFIPLFILFINYFQIKPEEKALELKFGQAFILYKLKVRRWL
ncbi:MAG: isoprenylcysteine carboxylmethyltransferase family protein [Bacteroidota bacterium]